MEMDPNSSPLDQFTSLLQLPTTFSAAAAAFHLPCCFHHHPILLLLPPPSLSVVAGLCHP
jgi:hypothetical protein